jgi:hypothetical protein
MLTEEEERTIEWLNGLSDDQYAAVCQWLYDRVVEWFEDDSTTAEELAEIAQLLHLDEAGKLH